MLFFDNAPDGAPPKPLRRRTTAKMPRIMKLTTVLLLGAFLQVSARGISQTITLSEKNAPLEQVLTEIKRQSGYEMVYNTRMIENAATVTIHLKQASLATALTKCLENQPLTFVLLAHTIIIKAKPFPVVLPADTSDDPASLRGRITDSLGNPLPGATLKEKAGKVLAIADANGNFEIKKAGKPTVLEISFTGYQERTITVKGAEQNLHIVLQVSNSSLDQIHVIGYGTTTKRFSTGSEVKITGEEISEQPVTNPLQALEGRAAGLSVIQSNGLPGSNVSVQIRGQNSITSGNNPLYVVDGVPFPSVSLDFVYGANAPAYGGISTLNSLIPSDIESIEVLKDADETAIYGSRGSNGVILITTKKGKQGKTKLDINVSSGAGEVTRKLKMLSPQQYYELRQNAFLNDGVTPTISNAPDLLSWDKSKTTDFENLLIGNMANRLDATISLSGGNQTTSFLMGSTYHHESTVFPGSLGYGRGGGHLNVNHISLDKKFSANVSVSYTSDANNLNSTDLTPYYNLPPDYPLYDSTGKLNWQGGQNNPLAFLQQPYKSVTDNFMTNATLQYTALPGLDIKANLGYNKISIDQIETMPSTSQNPTYHPTGSSNFVTNSTSTALIEPQVNYKRRFGKALISLLAGSTFQSNKGNLVMINAYNYASDALLQSAYAAGGTFVYNYNSIYKFESAFGRLNLNWDGKYILNANFRRDGSSRFGPGKQFGDFGSIAAAWLFSEELKNTLPWLSFGKLRASYGSVGNDQIADYGYLSSYTSTNYTYGGAPGLHPFGVANPDYSWEVNKKLEAAIDLGLCSDRILFSFAFFRNRSDNQLLGVQLPSQTGFGSYTANIPAEVLNTGIELELNTINVKNKTFKWSTSFNLTVPKNKLAAWPGLSESWQSNYYVTGQPLSPFILFHSTGVNPQTGVPTVADLNKDGAISYGLASTGAGDQRVAASRFPTLYGGLGNQFNYKNWRLDFLLQFVKQKGLGILSRTSSPPGTMQNTWSEISGRWQRPGDNTTIPAATATAGTAAYTAYNYYYQSDAAISDASFLRLKSLSVSYNINARWFRQIKTQQVRLYLQGENLLTFTHYLGFDPENSAQAGIPILPPLKMLTAGIQCTF